MSLDHNNVVTFLQLNDGTRMEAIPFPRHLWFGRVKCKCGEKFGSEEQYGIHYQSMHTSGKRHIQTPQGLVEIKK